MQSYGLIGRKDRVIVSGASEQSPGSLPRQETGAVKFLKLYISYTFGLIGHLS